MDHNQHLLLKLSEDKMTGLFLKYQSKFDEVLNSLKDDILAIR